MTTILQYQTYSTIKTNTCIKSTHTTHTQKTIVLKISTIKVLNKFSTISANIVLTLKVLFKNYSAKV